MVSVWLGKAIELIKIEITFAEKMLSVEQNSVQCPLKQQIAVGEKLKWTFSKTDYVEWIYGLHAILNQKGEKVQLKTLFDCFNRIFDMDVSCYSQTFYNIKTSKKEAGKPYLTDKIS